MTEFFPSGAELPPGSVQVLCWVEHPTARQQKPGLANDQCTQPPTWTSCTCSRVLANSVAVHGMYSSTQQHMMPQHSVGGRQRGSLQELTWDVQRSCLGCRKCRHPDGFGYRGCGDWLVTAVHQAAASSCMNLVVMMHHAAA